MNMPGAIARLVEGKELSQAEMLELMHLVMSGAATDAQIGGFLVALHMKGESVADIISAATVMRELVSPVAVSLEHLVDTCGTGGSGSNKFNVSTASAFVAAAAGAKVAKHGNRGATSKSGSADLLEAAGAKIMLSPDQVAKSIDVTGLGFLFALNHHSAMKHAIGPRREMGVRTIFNLLGPLTNPAGAKRQLIGVYERRWVRPMAEVLQALGSEHVMVVNSDDGLDEISISATSHLAELKDGKIIEFDVSPEDFGLKSSPLSTLVVENSEASLHLVRQALLAQDAGLNEGATNIVMLNAGAAIYIAGLSDSLAAGISEARTTIESGLAIKKMDEFVQFTQQLAED